MKELIEVFRMKELTLKVRANLIIKLGRLINEKLEARDAIRK